MSYALIKAERLKPACETYLAERKAAKDAQKEEIIQAEMSKRFFKAKSREQAIERNEEAFYWIDCRGGYRINRVEMLLSLAKASDDGFVRVKDDDIEIIEPYLTGPEKCCADVSRM